MKALRDAAKDFSLVQTSVLSSGSQNNKNDKGLGSRPVAPRPDEYVGLELT